MASKGKHCVRHCIIFLELRNVSKHAQNNSRFLENRYCIERNAYFCLPREVQKGSKIEEKNVAETGALKVRLLEPKVVPKGSQRLPKRGPKIMKNPCLGSQIAKIELRSSHVVSKGKSEGPHGGSTAAKGRPQQPLMASQDTSWEAFGCPCVTFGELK